MLGFRTKEIIDRVSDRVTKALRCRILQQIRLVTSHDGSGERFVILPIVQFKLANVRVDPGQVIADFGDKNDTTLAMHNVIVHDNK